MVHFTVILGISLICVGFISIFCKQSNSKPRASNGCDLQSLGQNENTGPTQGQVSQSLLPKGPTPAHSRWATPPGIVNTTPGYSQYLDGRRMSSLPPSCQLGMGRTPAMPHPKILWESHPILNFTMCVPRLVLGTESNHRTRLPHWCDLVSLERSGGTKGSGRKWPRSHPRKEGCGGE